MKTAFLFPGQGAQKIGMGMDLYDHNIIYKQTFNECQDGAQLDLQKACFLGDRMNESEVVQPAIFAHSMSLLAVLRDAGFEADIYAGLSLGEYSALTTAGALDAAQCAALVRKRGRIMDNAYEKGVCGMLSVIGLDIDKVSSVIEDYDKVYVANHISELQIVISGYQSDLSELEPVFLEQGAKMAAKLDVAGPFHSTLLSEAAKSFYDVLSAEPIGEFSKTVYANVLGKPYESGSDVKQLLTDQMCTRVRWHECTENMISSGIDNYIEIGPGNVLGKLLKRRIGKDGASVASINSAKTLDKFLAKAGQ